MTDRILELVRWEFIAATLITTALTALAYLALRRRWHDSRRRLVAAELRRLSYAVLVSLVATTAFELLRRTTKLELLGSALGLVALVSWLVAVLRVARVAVFEWLFARSEHEGVPVLLVDLVTLVATLIAGAGLLHEVFGIELTSLLATSAVASVVLGLAMQDTLGHLFAGISLQLDRPFRLGDWVEVRSGSERITGQVLEVSWRATQLIALTDELITIPNKSVAQGLVLNYSGRERPFVRSYVFRVPLDAPLGVVKATLLDAARATDGVLAEPGPIPLVIETTESWVTVKLLYFLADFGRQYTIADDFQVRALEGLAARGIALASARLSLARPGPRRSWGERPTAVL